MESYVRFNQNLVVNFVKVESKIYEDLDAAKTAKRSVTSSTVLYNNFENNVDALYYNIGVTDYTRSYIYRRRYFQTYYDYVCLLKGAIAFNDYNITNNNDYIYMAVVAAPRDDGTFLYEIYEPIDDQEQRIFTHTRWDSWSISNVEASATDNNILYQTGTIWKLGLNLNEENLTQNIGVTSWDTLGKYPKISVGQKNYESSTVTCLLGSMQEVVDDRIVSTKEGYDDVEHNIVCKTEDKFDTRYRYTERNNINTRYGREVEKLDAWRKFCSDGELKLLKDLKGNAWIVQIVDMPSHSINHGAFNLPTTISFAWKEVMDINSVSIVSSNINEGD